MDFVYIIAGLALLVAGGEGLVRGSVSLAERFKVSKLLIGMVIVGFGTSTPELLVSLKAALAGSSEIAVGNVVGSNIANILLILAAGALIMPLTSKDPALKRDGLMMVFATLVLWAAAAYGVLTLWMGVMMVALLLGYVVYNYRQERLRLKKVKADVYVHEAEDRETVHLSPWLAGVFVLAGLVLLVFGADLLVKGAVAVAQAFGVPEAVIGLTLVAVGTSLPELAATVAAAMRRHADVALGNIIGSNIFNILFILGVSSMITPIEVAERFVREDIPIALLVAASLAFMVYRWQGVSRNAGVFYLMVYAGYTAWLFVQA
jgi:cation:H+ antiporter